MLRIVFRNRKRNIPKAEGVSLLGVGSGPQGRINKMRKLVTALIRHERIEGFEPYIDESRGYAERLIHEAIKKGDTHKQTMELVDYWVLEKDLIHKLFKVIVPRLKDTKTSYTAKYNLPTPYPGKPKKQAILELRGNPWPPVKPHEREVRNSLVNVLIEEMRKDRFETRRQQAANQPSSPAQASLLNDQPKSMEKIDSEISIKLEGLSIGNPKEGAEIAELGVDLKQVRKKSEDPMTSKRTEGTSV